VVLGDRTTRERTTIDELKFRWKNNLGQRTVRYPSPTPRLSRGSSRSRGVVGTSPSWSSSNEDSIVANTRETLCVGRAEETARAHFKVFKNESPWTVGESHCRVFGHKNYIAMVSYQLCMDMMHATYSTASWASPKATSCSPKFFRISSLGTATSAPF
jgi:hypothetical protein